MKQLFASLIIVLLFVSCDKDLGHFDDVFQVHFKFQGKEYSAAIKKNTPNPIGVSDFHISPTKFYQSQGAMFQINDSTIITLNIGNFLRDADDYPGTIDRLKQMLPVGNREYNLWNGDSTVSNGVAIDFNEGINYYATSKWDVVKQKYIPITDEQTGSSFVISSVKQVDYIAGKNNAFIVKGTFNCNLFDSQNRKVALTDGTFTAIYTTM